MVSAVTNYLNEFHGTLDEPVPAVPTAEQAALRARLIDEEHKEVQRAIMKLLVYPDGETPERRANLAKELADLEYVVRGTTRLFGFPQDAVLDEVHRSNMTKFAAGVHLREDGKLLKGPAFEEADIEAVLRAHEAED